MQNKTFKAVMRNIGYLTQLGFSIAFPMIACTMGSVWLCRKYSFGSWVILLGVIFGLISGISCFMTFVRYAMKDSSRKDE